MVATGWIGLAAHRRTRVGTGQAGSSAEWPKRVGRRRAKGAEVKAEAAGRAAACVIECGSPGGAGAREYASLRLLRARLMGAAGRIGSLSPIASGASQDVLKS